MQLGVSGGNIWRGGGAGVDQHPKAIRRQEDGSGEVSQHWG